MTTYDLMTENWIIPQDDYIINFEDWGPGNPLFITGASGDEKSTLARKLGKEYSAIVISSDIVLLRLFKTKEAWDNMIQKFQDGYIDSHGINFGDSIGMDYVTLNPELPYGLKDPITKKAQTDIINAELNKFYLWFMVQSSKNPKYKNQLYILEGCNLCNLPPELMATKPLIVVGGSRLRSFIRRIKRNKSEGAGVLKSIFKYIKMYTTVQKPLDDAKDLFLKDLHTYNQIYGEGGNNMPKSYDELLELVLEYTQHSTITMETTSNDIISSWKIVTEILSNHDKALVSRVEKFLTKWDEFKKECRELYQWGIDDTNHNDPIYIWLFIQMTLSDANYIWNFDWKANKEEFFFGIKKILEKNGINLQIPKLGISGNDVPSLTYQLNQFWKHRNVFLICIDNDSDMYSIAVCNSQSKLFNLKQALKEVNQKVRGPVKTARGYSFAEGI